MTMIHYELPIFAFLAAVLVLIPLPSHWRARNVATLAIIIWLFAVDVVYGINAIVWSDNFRSVMPVWCDIATKIIVGTSYALPISTMCVCKHLEEVSSSRKASFDYKDRRRRMIFEGVMCFGLPLVFMALHYIVQGHRFDIIEVIGCQPAVYISIQAVLIIWLPQLLFSIITMIYAIIALHHFVRRRLTFASHLQNSNSALTTNRYLRLMAMAVTNMIWGTILTSHNLYNNVSGGLRPWTTWDDVHSNWDRIDGWPLAIMPAEFRRIMMLLWWAMPVSSFIFFIFFGFGEEAKKEYLRCWTWFKTAVLQRSLSKEEAIKSSGSLGNLNLKPLKLVDQKANSVKYPSISNPMLISSSNPSFHTLNALLPTKFEAQNSQLKTVEGGSAIDHPDTLSISTFSIYAQPYDLAPRYCSSLQSPASAATQVNDQPPRLPEIPLPSPLSTSPPPSPTPSVPESVGPTLYKLPPRPGCLPSPIYHRPFCGPSIDPVTRSHPSAQHGVVVIVHRQASVDEIV